MSERRCGAGPSGVPVAVPLLRCFPQGCRGIALCCLVGGVGCLTAADRVGVVLAVFAHDGKGVAVEGDCVGTDVPAIDEACRVGGLFNQGWRIA